MYKLIHIHTDIKFVDDTVMYERENFSNQIFFIGKQNESIITKLNTFGIKYTIFDDTHENVIKMIKQANNSDGVIFHSLSNSQIQILLSLNRKVKKILKFFGWELYKLYPKEYLLSSKTLSLLPNNQLESSLVRTLYHNVKRKINILLNREYSVDNDNQKNIYKYFDAIQIINEFEYKELKQFFYLPKLITRQFTNFEHDVFQLKNYSKSNSIIIGNSSGSVNNHIDVLDIIKSSTVNQNVQFNLFFSYGNEPDYAQKIKLEAKEIENLNFIEQFLSNDAFEKIYSSTSSLVINSYRQHAVGNIIIAIKYGCKIYLNKKSSTYQWLISKGFLISDVHDDLKNDLESGNIKLSTEQQQQNIDCFRNIINEYSVSDLLNNVIKVLNE